MSIVVLKLPDVKRETRTRPRKCPYCEGGILQRWGQVRKPVRDTRCRTIRVYRYRFRQHVDYLFSRCCQLFPLVNL